jgi:[ribosomal protein S5]-alanine N-acetyltransferase
MPAMKAPHADLTGAERDERETVAWLGTLPQRRARGIALQLAVVEESDQPIGISLLSEVSRRDRRRVVGSWLGRAYWGTGASRETKAPMAHLAFGRLELDRLAAYADVLNTRSQAALERPGFKREGVLHAFHRHYDAPRDVALYALLRRDWERGELARVPAQLGGSARRAHKARGAHARWAQLALEGLVALSRLLLAVQERCPRA